MFHRPPRPEDNVHNIVGGKGTKVLLKNKVIGASLTEAAWSPRVFFIFWLNPYLGHGGSPCLLTCPGFKDPREREPKAGHPPLFRRAPVA